MFTGLIETIGMIQNSRRIAAGMQFEIESVFESGELLLGESIAVDGICVTVEDFNPKGFSFTISMETQERSAIGDKAVGQKVHLERALRLGDRLGGHIVQGHVDGISQVLNLTRKENGADLVISIPETLRPYVVEKGSLAAQGVSLTVTKIDSEAATLVLIPVTLKSTYLSELKPGDRLNIEVDILGKYVETFVSQRNGKIDELKLRDWGFE